MQITSKLFDETYICKLDNGDDIWIKVKWEQSEKQGSKYIDEPEYEMYPFIDCITVDAEYGSVDITEIVDNNEILNIQELIKNYHE